LGSILEFGSQRWYCVLPRVGMQQGFSKCKNWEQRCKSI